VATAKNAKNAIFLCTAPAPVPPKSLIVLQSMKLRSFFSRRALSSFCAFFPCIKLLLKFWQVPAKDPSPMLVVRKTLCRMPVTVCNLKSESADNIYVTRPSCLASHIPKSHQLHSAFTLQFELMTNSRYHPFLIITLHNAGRSVLCDQSFDLYNASTAK
jgi:hypothetical protein